MSWQHVDDPVLLATKQIHRFFRDFIFHLSFSGVLRWLSAGCAMKDGLWICHWCFIGWKSGERLPTHLSPHKTLNNKMLCAKMKDERCFDAKTTNLRKTSCDAHQKDGKTLRWKSPFSVQKAVFYTLFDGRRSLGKWHCLTSKNTTNYYALFPFAPNLLLYDKHNKKTKEYRQRYHHSLKVC